jgi:hypothetical protein
MADELSCFAELRGFAAGHPDPWWSKSPLRAAGFPAEFQLQFRAPAHPILTSIPAFPYMSVVILICRRACGGAGLANALKPSTV